MKKLGIEETADNDINEVSGGQLQRACICRSMINNPKVIFADEPTSDLDEENLCLVLELLKEAAQTGTAVLIVTHDLEALKVADKHYRMQSGIIEDQICRKL